MRKVKGVSAMESHKSWLESTDRGLRKGRATGENVMEEDREKRE